MKNRINSEKIEDKGYAGLACIDMDGTLVEDRLVYKLGLFLGISDKINEILEDMREHRIRGFEGSEQIARLLKGVYLDDIKRIAHDMKISEGAEKLVEYLKLRNYLVCIVTDSYVQAAEVVGSKVGIEYVWGNKLIVESGICTGEIKMPLGCKGDVECRYHSVCKLYALQTIAQEEGISLEKTIAIGDSESDLCMIKEANLGIAYRPKSEELRKVAKIVIDTNFYELLDVIKEKM